MREIKFRAWDLLAKKMITWEEMLRRPMLLRRILDGSNLTYISMQYTGLKDKNGVDYYASDIFELYGELHLIYWDKESASFLAITLELYNCYKTEKHYLYSTRLNNIGLNACGLIGNIYENPKLLEATNG